MEADTKTTPHITWFLSPNPGVLLEMDPLPSPPSVSLLRAIKPCGLDRMVVGVSQPVIWVAVKKLKLSYHNPKAILFTIYAYCGNLN